MSRNTECLVGFCAICGRRKALRPCRGIYQVAGWLNLVAQQDIDSRNAGTAPRVCLVTTLSMPGEILPAIYSRHWARGVCVGWAKLRETPRPSQLHVCAYLACHCRVVSQEEPIVVITARKSMLVRSYSGALLSQVLFATIGDVTTNAGKWV